MTNTHTELLIHFVVGMRNKGGCQGDMLHNYVIKFGGGAYWALEHI